jgi:hypothetical protein
MSDNPCKCGGKINECVLDDNIDTSTGCIVLGDGIICPDSSACNNWDITQSNDACLISDYIEEKINISGAPLNVYKMLGVHAQNTLSDLTGDGSAISSSYLGNFPPKNAFIKFDNEWRSAETGSDVVKYSFIGYDFGPIRLNNGRLRYGIDTYVKRNLSSIKIMQGCDSKNRVTQVRIERSMDGKKWFGVSIEEVADCDGWFTINFPSSVQSRYWRIRPLSFNGSAEDWWSIRGLVLSDSEKTEVSNIQDKIFLENRDRSYQTESIPMKCSYTPIDTQSFLRKWGMSFDNDYYLEVGFRDALMKLGRPFVIGDILQLPSETQYTPDMTPVLKYLEVTDVSWSVNGFTPSWQPTMQRLTAKPLIASQETQDITGKLTRSIDSSGLMDIDDGVAGKKYQDYSGISQNIKAESNNYVPEKGEDYAVIKKLSKDVIDWGDKIGKDMRRYDRNRNVYGIDAMPPNELPYTQGDEFPTKPSNGDYHRLTYDHINSDLPARLYRYSSAKERWIYLETDRRASIRDTLPPYQEFIDSNTSSVTAPNDISNELEKIDKS